MKYDTNETGWRTILVDYIADVLEKFIEEYDPEGEPFEMNSGVAFRYELELLKKQDRTISRASIIFGLNRMVDMGILAWRDMTGKGGHHRIYRLAMTPHELEVYVVGILLKRINDNWPRAFQEGLNVVNLV